jgi:hypothetical protein
MLATLNVSPRGLFLWERGQPGSTHITDFFRRRPFLGASPLELKVAGYYSYIYDCNPGQCHRTAGFERGALALRRAFARLSGSAPPARSPRSQASTRPGARQRTSGETAAVHDPQSEDAPPGRLGQGGGGCCSFDDFRGSNAVRGGERRGDPPPNFGGSNTGQRPEPQHLVSAIAPQRPEARSATWKQEQVVPRQMVQSDAAAVESRARLATRGPHAVAPD